MAALETVGVVQGLTAQLEVYISGFPTPTSSHITWYDPSGTDITDTRPPGVTFQDSGRRVVLASVQPQQAGLYECTVVLSPVPYMGATTSILLEVYGEFNIHTLASKAKHALCGLSKVLHKCNKIGIQYTYISNIMRTLVLTQMHAHTHVHT